MTTIHHGDALPENFMDPPFQPYWRAWLRSQGRRDDAPHPVKGFEPWRYILWIREMWRELAWEHGYGSWDRFTMEIPKTREMMREWLDKKFPVLKVPS